MSTAQNLRDAAVAFPMPYIPDLDSQILWLHVQEHEWPDSSTMQCRTFMLIAACSLDGGDTGHANLHKLIDALEAFDDRLAQWAKAYPLDIFPEPDFAKARKALSIAEITLDAVTASNMRHVVTKLSSLFEPVRKALKETP